MIGDGNTIREFVTINRGTGEGGGVTQHRRRQLDHGLRAHRPRLRRSAITPSSPTTPRWPATSPSRTTSSSAASPASTSSAGSATHAFTGMGSNDQRRRAAVRHGRQRSTRVPRGINSEGLKRRGFDAEQHRAIKRAYETLYLSGAQLDEASGTRRDAAGSETCARCCDFIDRSERSCCGERGMVARRAGKPRSRPRSSLVQLASRASVAAAGLARYPLRAAPVPRRDPLPHSR